jgi:hypothetical protein
MEFIFDEDDVCRTPGRDWSSEEEDGLPQTPGKATSSTNTLFTCEVPVCDGLAFRQERQLIKHFATVHRPTVLMHRCQMCPLQAINRRDVVRHMKKKHGGTGQISSTKVRNKKYLSPKNITINKVEKWTVEKNRTTEERLAELRRRKKEAEAEEERLMTTLQKEKEEWRRKAEEMEKRWQKAEEEIRRLRKMLG